jgi:competence protein ComFC
LSKLFFYSKIKSSEPQNRLIYYIKRNKNKRVSKAIALELITLIKSEVSRMELEELPLIISAPRSKSAVFEHGFDQTDIICRAIAENSVFEYCNILKRRRGGKKQKALTSGERRKNIKNLIYADEIECQRIKGKNVILIDDIVTTGATMSACTQILKKLEVKNIVCIAIASDIKT